ncbi:MAG: type I methionyl aminopeptidase [Clostridiales bacterium]|jgi:methionyl aminopeptidase|nr:type I methionyl aminopeptidase [Clostridiales bacterium]
MIILKSKREIDMMREAAKVTGEILSMLKGYIKPGISTLDIDSFVEDRIRHYNMIPSFKGYGGFPGSACVSLNDEIVHGIPSKDRILQEGDIVSVDTGSTYRGYCSDAARTYPVGQISDIAAKLIKVTEESFFEGLKYCMDGYKISDIGHSVQAHAEKNGFSVIRDYTGHGLGKNLHEDPQIPNYGKPNKGPRIRSGMVIAVEPMICQGDYETRTLPNEWTVVTEDGLLSSHYENTIAITDGEPELLTI